MLFFLQIHNFSVGKEEETWTLFRLLRKRRESADLFISILCKEEFLMKKSIVSALTTALVLGAASTTFAAANPFEDVPADHWAYDAIAQLAADGVIEGYGDGTYRGDQEITRYEMAQMIARAMAKGGGDKALIDKLAAEFADELNNLGVRVAALEKKVDNVKWQGTIRYRYINERHHKNPLNDEDIQTNTQYVTLRLEPEMTINKNWTGMAGIYYGGLNAASKQNLNNAHNINDFHLKWACVQGVYGNTTIDLGRTFFYTNVDEGMIMDDYLAGGRVTFGKDLKFSVAAGRVDDNWLNVGTQNYVRAAAASSYVGGELTYNKDKLSAGVGYHHFANETDWNLEYGAKSADIWVVGLGYKFGDFRLSGAYAQNTKGENGVIEGNGDLGGGDQRKAYNIQLTYKGAKANKPGTFGIEAGYRHLGRYASLVPTYDYSDVDMKGWFVGANVTILQNTILMLGYEDGTKLSTDKKEKIYFSRVKFLF